MKHRNVTSVSMGLRSFKLNPYLFSPCAPFATAENDNVCSWRSTSGVWKWKVHELRQIHIGSMVYLCFSMDFLFFYWKTEYAFLSLTITCDVAQLKFE